MRKGSTLVILAVVIFSLFFFLQPRSKGPVEVNEVKVDSISIPVATPIVIKPQIEMTATPSVGEEEPSSCDFFQKRYGTLEVAKKSNVLHQRFENIHVEHEGRVYRLRRFFKDGENGETLKFLVFLESNSENADIIENSSLTPGKLYLELIKKREEAIYKEEGDLLDNGVFLYFVNDKLKSIKGGDESEPLDCLY